MYIIDRNTRPDSEYSKIAVSVRERNGFRFSYNNIERITISDFGLMEILFNNGDIIVRNIHRNITYCINLTQRKEDE